MRHIISGTVELVTPLVKLGSYPPKPPPKGLFASGFIICDRFNVLGLLPENLLDALNYFPGRSPIINNDGVESLVLAKSQARDN